MLSLEARSREASVRMMPPFENFKKKPALAQRHFRLFVSLSQAIGSRFYLRQRWTGRFKKAKVRSPGVALKNFCEESTPICTQKHSSVLIKPGYFDRRAFR